MDTNARNFVRTAVLATLAAGSFLIASRPARADSVTPERALLGRVDVPDDASAAPKTWAAVSPDEHLPRVVDGQGALLNRRDIARDPSGIASADPATRATQARLLGMGRRDGAQALLNHAI